MMVTRSYMSRREVEQQSFSLSVTIFVPLGAVLLQVLLPRVFHGLAILDLPFIVTLFFAISRRSPIAGTATGACIGLLQDVLTGQPIGVNGMAKSVIGYAGASLGSRIDVENTKTRTLLAFGFSLVQSILLYLIDTIQSRSFEIRLMPMAFQPVPMGIGSLGALPVREVFETYGGPGLSREEVKQKLDGLMNICREKVRQLVSKDEVDASSVNRWIEAMDLLYDSKAALDMNANQKLMATRLAIRLARLFPSQKFVTL